MRPRTLLLLAFLASIPPALADGGSSAEWMGVEGTYELNPDHVHVREELILRYRNETHLLGGQSLSPVFGLSNISLRSPGRGVTWDYDGTVLSWSFKPPLVGGEEISLTREWDIALAPDDDGFRTFQVTAPSNDNAVLSFRTRDVDIVDSSLTLDQDGRFAGELSSEDHHVVYSTRYKLYDYSWFCVVQNSGGTSAKVQIVTPLPRDDGFQAVLDEVVPGLAQDHLGNREAILNFTMDPWSTRNLTLRSRILTWTWDPPAIPWEMEAQASDFLNHEDRYWQFQDPSIAALASTLGRAGDVDMLRELSQAVGDLLEYSLTERRMGALWALSNRKGSCMEHADLYIALARALEIPAFYVSGFVGSGENGGTGHAWAAAWRPNPGWIGVDPTWPGALNLDSGRLVFRYCNPDDLGLRVSSVGGNLSISDWGDAWRYRELDSAEALSLLGIDEVSIINPLWALIALAIISRSPSKTVAPYSA